MALTREGGYYLPGTQVQEEFAKLYANDPRVARLGIYERAALKRRISEVLAVDDLTPEQVMKMIAGGDLKKGAPVRLVHDYARDAEYFEPGPEIFSSKEELGRSLF